MKKQIKSKLITITCVTLNKKNIISSIRGMLSNLYEDNTSENIIEYGSKEEIISSFRRIENENIPIEIKTSKNVEILIVKKNGIDSFLRTRGDESEDNDLIDAPICLFKIEHLKKF